MEQKLWMAISALEEQAAMLRHLTSRHADDAAPLAARANAARRAERLAELAQLIRAQVRDADA